MSIRVFVYPESQEIQLSTPRWRRTSQPNRADVLIVKDSCIKVFLREAETHLKKCKFVVPLSQWSLEKGESIQEEFSRMKQDIVFDNEMPKRKNAETSGSSWLFWGSSSNETNNKKQRFVQDHEKENKEMGLSDIQKTPTEWADWGGLLIESFFLQPPEYQDKISIGKMREKLEKLNVAIKREQNDQQKLRVDKLFLEKRNWKNWAQRFNCLIVDDRGFQDRPEDELYTASEFLKRSKHCTLGSQAILNFRDFSDFNYSSDMISTLMRKLEYGEVPLLSKFAESKEESLFGTRHPHIYNDYCVEQFEDFIPEIRKYFRKLSLGLRSLRRELSLFKHRFDKLNLLNETISDSLVLIVMRKNYSRIDDEVEDLGIIIRKISEKQLRIFKIIQEMECESSAKDVLDVLKILREMYPFQQKF